MLFRSINNVNVGTTSVWFRQLKTLKQDLRKLYPIEEFIVFFRNRSYNAIYTVAMKLSGDGYL